MTSITPDLAGKSTPQRDWLTFASGVSVLGILMGLWLALSYAGTDLMQGEVQRLFYLHLPVFFAAASAMLASFITAIIYLIRRKVVWDWLAVALVEVGVILTIATIVTGSIWARPTWNTWWTASPRIVATVIMALIYIAYLFLRSGFAVPEKRRLFSATYLIGAFIVVMYTLIAARLREDGIHPTVLGTENASNGMAMSPRMQTALIVNILVWVGLVMPVLVGWRLRLQTWYEKRRLRQAALH